MRPIDIDQTERDLRRALDAGDRSAADRAASALDATRPAQRTPSLVGSALWYAARGVPVFPLQPGSKIPFPRTHGLKDATTDADQIRARWERTPSANIGLATGHVFDAVDIDGLAGQRSRAAEWCGDRDCIAPDCSHEGGTFAAIDADALAKVLTPRPGGMHIYVPPTGEGNLAGIAEGIDYRGRGGYVVGPPSQISPEHGPNPGHYRFLGQPTGLAGLQA